MKTRIISSVFMLPLAILVVLGGKALLIGCFLVGLMGIREFYKGFEAIGVKASYVVGYIGVCGLYGLNLFINDFRWYMLWFFGVVLLSLLCMFNIESRKLEDGLVTAMGMFYVVFFSFHVTLVEQIPEYGKLVWLVFLTAFGTDVMAYFSGYLFGKHKLCPKISPKKTVEGAIGGILGSVLLSLSFSYFIYPELLLHCGIIGIIGGIVSQFGDLTASIFKRKMGIKDYGNLIPGHGGIMDRFDSVLFTAPMVYYYITLVLQK